MESVGIELMVKRNSNIELLRLVAMVFITAHHFAIWGYFIGNEVHTVQPNTVWLQFLEIFGKIGVDLFILITGYFAINPRPTFQKVWQLTNTVRFYALGLFIILLVCGQLQFNTDLMWRSLFPTIRSMYWFITIYAILYIFSSYLSRFIGHLRRGQAVSFIALNVLIFMVLPTFLKGWGSQLTDLLPVFFFGLYLRMYGVSKRLTKLLKILLGVTVVIAVLSIGLSDLIGNNRPASQAIADATSYFVTGSSPLAFVVAAYIFSQTIQRQPRGNRLINWMGSSAVAIYLIQDYEPFRQFLWQNIFHVRDLANQLTMPVFIGYSFLVVTVIVLGAILVDKLLGRVLMRPAQALLAIEMLVTHYVTCWFKNLIKLTGYQPEH